jgi:AcrR family transcriptional regulator
VINERGYEAANFQAIALRAGLSRPTMHYYFHTREEIYDCLVAEMYSIVADCIARAKQEDTLLNQLSAFVTAGYRSGLADRSMIRFAVMARLESHRRASLRENPAPVADAVHVFYASIVDDAIARGEIPADTDASAVVSMLLAMFLGMVFYAGFIVDQHDPTVIAKQLYRLIAHGLLDRQRNGHPLTMAPVVPVTG